MWVMRTWCLALPRCCLALTRTRTTLQVRGASLTSGFDAALMMTIAGLRTPLTHSLTHHSLPGHVTPLYSLAHVTSDDEEGDKARDGELDEAAWAKMQSFEARSIDPQTLQEVSAST
jgi:hypothetical protein